LIEKQLEESGSRFFLQFVEAVAFPASQDFLAGQAGLQMDAKLLQCVPYWQCVDRLVRHNSSWMKHFVMLLFLVRAVRHICEIYNEAERVAVYNMRGGVSKPRGAAHLR